MAQIKVTLIPDPITMKSIEYDWLGRIKRIEFRSLEEIKASFPEFSKRMENAAYIVEASKSTWHRN